MYTLSFVLDSLTQTEKQREIYGAQTLQMIQREILEDEHVCMHEWIGNRKPQGFFKYKKYVQQKRILS